MRQILDFAFDVSDETGNDPIYAAPDYSAEFFATVQQEFSNLVDDPDYAALLSLFGTNLLYRTGSRPVAREAEEWGRPSKIEHPSQLRAIPNNAILQQLGFMAVTLHGVGRAVSKDPEMFQAMRERSARFRRAVQMVAAALIAPRSTCWRIHQYAQSRDVAQWRGARAAASKGQGVARIGPADGTARPARPAGAAGAALAVGSIVAARRDRAGRDRAATASILLHGIRVAVIQRICLLAMEIPNFSPQLGVTRDDILAESWSWTCRARSNACA